ncbi:MAG: ECF-type sigma factor [Thermoanaerobaculia bacterium]
MLLRTWKAGDPGLSGRLIELLYGELKRIARRQLARERRAQTLRRPRWYTSLPPNVQADPRQLPRPPNHFLAVATTY